MAEPGIVPAIVGPTASGKSAVALAVAEDLDAEIVAVDAFTVYRGMDVGTAKPTVEERERVPHHLVDVLSPAEVCSVEWFQSAARAAIDEVVLRGRTPLLVGGSGLYFRAVVDPLEFPPADPQIRDQLVQRYADDPAAAHRELTAVDPDAAGRMDPSNLRRAIRALEVHQLTGRPFSDWYRAWTQYRSSYDNLKVVGVDTGRADLARRIDERADTMMAGGWLEECRRLAALDLSPTAQQAIGYRELLDHLAGGLDLDAAVTRIKTRTRQYAVRQDRWFRADPRVQWTSADNAPDLVRSLCNS